MYYAGIGSRNVPEFYHDLIRNLAEILANYGYVLRSGGAEGCDKLFEEGCYRAHGKKEIYLPWKGFNGSKSKHIVYNHEAFVIAKKFHPNWEALSPGARKLQARNSHQVLGRDLKTPSRFILCYTPSGSGSGGTGQAIRVANHYGIPVFDLGMYDDLSECISDFTLFLSKLKEETNEK